MLTVDASDMTTYSEAPNKVIRATSGIDYAYRDIGDGEVPVVLLQHFRGNLDNWDPALIDALASSRRVVTFDNVGVGMTTGTTPGSVVQMAHDALAFLSSLNFEQVDLLGFSIGSFVAQEIALLRPDVLRRLILASSAPKGAAGMHGWAPDVIGAVGQPEPNPDGYLDVFFARSPTSRQAGQETLDRIMARRQDRDLPTSWEARLAQYDALRVGYPKPRSLAATQCHPGASVGCERRQRPDDPAQYSYLIAGLVPQARLKVYPDSAHGFLFQHHDQFASDVDAFLS